MQSRAYKTPAPLREAMLAFLKERRARWIAENGPCARCGFWGDLEVDHVDPRVKVTHKVWGWSDERRSKELQKCQVLCRFCHSIKTADERRRARVAELIAIEADFRAIADGFGYPQVGPQVKRRRARDVA